MATRLNTKLYRTIGITFSFKQFFQEFLLDLKTNSLVTSIALTAPELASYTIAVDNFIRCNPSMGFSAKQYAYEALQLVAQGIKDHGTITELETIKLERSLLAVERLVGIEGEGDFHFQQAVYQLAEVISAVTGETVQIPSSVTGEVITISVFDGGTGFTVSQTDLEVDFDSSESGDGTTGSTVLVDTNADGEVVLGEYTVVAGSEGFYVGQIVVLDDPAAPASTVALAEIVSIA